MSASSKKKLRNEQNTAKMTERQLAEKKEAKKIKIMTVSFTAVLALILVVAIAFSAVRIVTTSGIREKNTIAVTVGDTKLTNAQLNYYYVDAVFEFANNYGSYALMFGLDVSKPLDEQYLNEETGETWADNFTNSAITNAQATYALCADAEANGFSLTEEEIATMESDMSQLSVSAAMSGFSNVDDYIQAYYGPGASLEGYKEYTMMNTLAQNYYAHYSETLTYDDAALRAGEESNEKEFNSYSYNYYYLSSNKFLQGGTTAEDGTVTYSDEEKADALKAAEAAAKALTEAGFTSVEELDEAIANLEINADLETPAKSTAHLKYAYSNVTDFVKEWVTDDARITGDITYLENATTIQNEDGTETKTVNGYYVVYFVEKLDNNYPLANVRHILIQPEGGTYNSSTNTTTYSAEELAAAKVEAEALLAEWKAGKATEETFGFLATEHTADPGSKDNGGLYEDIYPGQMVPSFNDWCFDESRQPGDTGIVESDYGCHIMFYVGDSETSYRDYLIETYLRVNDTQSWYDALIEAYAVTEGNTKYLSRDMVLSNNG